MLGFESLKDILDVVVVPVALFGLGIMLPRLFEGRRKKVFIQLIRREVEEMAPRPSTPQSGVPWHAHLKKRFIHEEIFSNPSENRDFILSLSPELAYDEHQLWTHYNEATRSSDARDLAEQGARFSDYLRSVCRLLDGRERGELYAKTCKPWEELLNTAPSHLKDPG